MAEMRLWEAAAKGERETMVNLLQEDPLILDRVCFSCSNMNPLHIASAKGHVQVVETLASAAPDLCMSRDCSGRNPLHVAAVNGQLEVLRLLIQINPVAAQEKADHDQTVLHLCVKQNQLEAMREILAQVKDRDFLNAKDDKEDTILHLAARYNRHEIIEYLLTEEKINLRALDANGRTAYIILRQNGGHGGSLPRRLKHLRTIYDSFLLRRWSDILSQALMVVMGLIITMSFQAGITPPGGFWQDTPSDNSHKAGESIMAHYHPTSYKTFITTNTIAFLLSNSVMIFITSGMTPMTWVDMFILVVIVSIALTSAGVAYVTSIVVAMPENQRKSYGRSVEIAFYIWCSLLVSCILMALCLRYRMPKRCTMVQIN